MRSPDNVSPRRWLTVPNFLSFARLATVPIFVWLFVTKREDLAVGLYGAAAFTDFFDGYIARRTNSVTELGRVLDPLADRIFIGALAVALVARGLLSPVLAASILVRDLLVVAAFVVLEGRTGPRIRVNNLGKLATALLLAGLSFLALSATSLGVPGAVRTAAMAMTVAGAAAYWVAGALYAREAVEPR